MILRAGIFQIRTVFKYQSNYDYYDTVVWGTEKYSALTILEATLNLKNIEVYEELDGGKTLNRFETAKIGDIQERMLNEFQGFVWQNETIKRELIEVYCTRYQNIRKRVFDGNYLHLSNLNPSIHLHDNQKSAIARIIQTNNTLLAHEVGAGKTYIMISSGMELIRLGKSKKNLYVIPNNIMNQWKKTFLRLYPNANLFVVDNTNFNPAKRKNTLLAIKNNKYDAILMSYSSYDMLPLSKKHYEDLFNPLINKLLDLENKYHSLDVVKQIDKLHEKLFDVVSSVPTDMLFDDLAIDALFVDEAHNYKNLTIKTRINMARGMNFEGSKRANDMLSKVREIQARNGHIIFATATPITNSITELYAMQLYLQSRQLKAFSIDSFDSWIGMFVKRESQVEVDVDTSKFRTVTRFSRFYNVPELASILANVADFYKVNKDTDDIPAFDGYTDSVEYGNADFKAYLDDLSERADNVRHHIYPNKDKKDNMLLITTDGRKAALDMRLVDPDLDEDINSKVTRCAINVYTLYMNNPNTAQIVFSDISTPSKGFNLYDELACKLEYMGMDRDKIAFIHEAKTDQKRDELFRKVNKGIVNVLIGSTLKLGTGVNVQERLIAIHHLDVPWRPSDIIQREGRLIRSGNTNPKVFIYRYITKGSFDAYSWQLLELKQRFINQIIQDNTYEREGADVDGVVLSYAEVKALAIDNPKIKTRIELTNRIDKLTLLNIREERQYEKNLNILDNIPFEITKSEESLSNIIDDLTYYKGVRDDILNSKDFKANAINIFKKIDDNIHKQEDTELYDLFGFKITVPAFMVPKIRKNKEAREGEKEYEYIPYINICRKNKYMIEVVGYKALETRVINFLENLDTLSLKYKDNLNNLLTKKETVEEAIKNKINFMDKIIELKAKVEELDKEMGISTDYNK